MRYVQLWIGQPVEACYAEVMSVAEGVVRQLRCVEFGSGELRYVEVRRGSRVVEWRCATRIVSAAMVLQVKVSPGEDSLGKVR